MLLIIWTVLLITGLLMLPYGSMKVGAIIEIVGLFFLLFAISLSIIPIGIIPGTTKIVTNPQIYKIIYDDETAKAVEILTEEGDIHTIEEFTLKRNVNIEKSYIVKTEYTPPKIIKILIFKKNTSEYVLYSTK